MARRAAEASRRDFSPLKDAAVIGLIRWSAGRWSAGPIRRSAGPTRLFATLIADIPRMTSEFVQKPTPRPAAAGTLIPFRNHPMA